MSQRSHNVDQVQDPGSRSQQLKSGFKVDGCESGSGLIIVRCEQDRGNENQLACKCIVAKRTFLCPCWRPATTEPTPPESSWQDQRGPDPGPVQFWLLVYGYDDLSRCWQSNSFQVVAVGFEFLVSHRAAMLTESGKTLAAEGPWEEMMPNFLNVFENICNGKTNHDGVVPKMSPSGPNGNK